MHLLRTSIHDFCYTLLAFPRAWRFMLRHRLWEGLRQYGWVARALVAVGVIMAIYVITGTIDWFDAHANEPVYMAVVGSDGLVVSWLTELYESLSDSDGVLNMVTLVLLEVVIYHFMRRTLQIVLKKNVENAHAFKPFLDAQVRMIVVTAIATILQEVINGVLDGVLSDGWVTTGLTVGVQCGFMGFLIADNYNEQFGLSVKQSQRQLWPNYVGICLGLGLPLFLMLKVPLFGTILGPLVTSVTAAIVLRERSDLHIIGYQMTEKERKKAEKKAAKKARKAEKKARKAARRGLPA